jgi:hypothetical protein
MKNCAPNIVIFGSSKPKPDSPNYIQAFELGKSLALAGYQITNGGYGGTMEASAKGASENGAKVTGVTCDIFERKGHNSFLENEIRTPDLKSRLETLIELGDAYVVLPGSTGTLLELAMAWELLNKGFMGQKPIVCLSDFWKPVIDTIIQSGEAQADCVEFAPDIKEVIGTLQAKLAKTSK